jgi:hypothetical protein
MQKHHCTEIFAGAMISVVQYCAATVHGLLETMAPPILQFESHVVHACSLPWSEWDLMVSSGAVDCHICMERMHITCIITLLANTGWHQVQLSQVP